MKSLLILTLLLLATAAYGISFVWQHTDNNLIEYYVLYRAHPDSLNAFVRVDTTTTRTITVDIPSASVVYITAVDTMGRESLPSPTLNMTLLPPAPTNLRAVIRFEMELQ